MGPGYVWRPGNADLDSDAVISQPLYAPSSSWAQRELSVPTESHLELMSSESQGPLRVYLYQGAGAAGGADSALLTWAGITLTKIGQED